MGVILRDLDKGFRAFFKEPLITAVVVLSVALGIAANTGVFTLIDAIMLKPLPLPFCLAVLLLVTGALMASLIPALRATRIDPVVALRHE